MNEFSIENTGKFDARLTDLESMVGATSSPDCQISNVEKMRGGGEIDWSICALGYVINPDGDDADEIKIVSGEIGGVAVAETKMVVLDAEFVYVRRTRADDTMLVTHAAAVPADDVTYQYFKLYEFSVTDEVATIKKIWRPFNIENYSETLPSTLGKDSYMVLQVSGGGAPVWDWARFV
jgi:hypothetical protein